MATLAPSLRRIFNELDTRWPHRDRRTDGWYRPRGVGPPSDHWPDSRGIVHAIDVDKDGILPDWLAINIARPRGVLNYIIWNRRIASVRTGWRWIAYTGSHPHTDHLHFSIFHTVAAENYSGGWAISARGRGTIGPAPPADPGLEGVDPYPYIEAVADWTKKGAAQVNGWARAIAGLRR